MPIELSDTRQVVERSLFEALRLKAVAAGYLPDVNAKVETNISTINSAQKKITLNSVNLTQLYSPSRKFTISGSTSSNGEYTVVSSIYQSSNTIITTLESIASSVTLGKASIYQYYDDNNGVASYEKAVKTIISTKGFVLDIFGVSSHRSKYQKKFPRIVIIKNQSLPGALGGDSKPIYIPVGNDPLAPTSFTSEVTPPQTVDFTYDIHIVSETAEQSRVGHAIVALALPKRGYVNIYNDSQTQFFVEAFSYRTLTDPSYNIMEDVYMYKVSDMYETNNTIVEEGIKPMTQINTDIEIGKASSPNTAQKFGDDLIVS